MRRNFDGAKLLLGAVLLALRCVLVRGFDKWLAMGVGAVTAWSAFIVIVAKSSVWMSLAEMVVK